MTDFIYMTDGYKMDHIHQYPPGTQYVQANWTARSTRIGGADSVVFFGLQYFLQRYLMEIAQQTFFDKPRYDVIDDYKRFLNSYLGPDNKVGTDHIKELHALGYVPLRFVALPEGTSVPYRVPMFTVENTHPDFFWVTNYIETMLSSVLWLPCTSASTAKRYKRILSDYARLTNGNSDMLNWQAHDFSFRGMENPDAAALSGAGHLLSFTGTDSIPAIQMLRKYYNGSGLIGGSVPATEHSVMCAGGKEDEYATYRRLLQLYPTGIVSIVSDTWDFWNVVTGILPALKGLIMERQGTLVIRPDSGDPVLILTGDASEPPGTAAHKGLIECLWETFGGTHTQNGFKVLDTHIGAIYGDSITEERARQICQRLMEKRFASTNVVFGIGSYTYQYVTRDTNGFAVKATWVQINNQGRQIFKDPKTDNSGKKSAKGRLKVIAGQHGALELVDGLDLDSSMVGNLMRTVWENGDFVLRENLADIRNRVRIGV